MLCHPIVHQIMAAPGFVIVQKSLFDRLQQHCEHCPDFVEQLQDLSHGRVAVVPRGRPSGESSKKRKTLHGSESRRPEPELPGSQQKTQSPYASQSKALKRARGKGSQTRPRKYEAAQWFLQNTPKATEWRKKQTERELSTVEQYEEAIRAFTDRTNVVLKREPREGDGQSDNELVAVAKRLALITQSSLANAKLQRSFASFQVLILLSYCGFLRKKDIPYDTIDKIIQQVTDAPEYDRRRLLQSALWINGLIVDLVRNGWTIYRATELFFLGIHFMHLTCEAELTPFSDALSTTYLIHIRGDENLQSILGHFRTEEFVTHDYSDCLSPEYTIPGLIASLLHPNSITANMYEPPPGNRSSTDEKVLGSKKYALPLVTH